jgi:hypothetical protein
MLEAGVLRIELETVFENTRWFKYDRDYLCVNKSQFVPVIFEPPCTLGETRQLWVRSHIKTCKQNTPLKLAMSFRWGIWYFSGEKRKAYSVWET